MPRIDAETAGQTTTSRQIFNLPFPRNRFFTGRGDILKSLHASFKGGEIVQALTGLGGIGKTQTALEFAYRYRESYRVVLWGNAHSRETLVTDFVSMAGLLNLPEKNAQDQSQAVDAVKSWLGNNAGWLLILDNADDLALAREFIPSGETGHVLMMLAGVCVLYYTHWSTKISEDRANALVETEKSRAALLTEKVELANQMEVERARLGFFQEQVLIEEEYVRAVEQLAQVKQRGESVINAITDPDVREQILLALGRPASGDQFKPRAGFITAKTDEPGKVQRR